MKSMRRFSRVQPARRAYSLIELTLALASTSVLVAAMGSLMVLATQGLVWVGPDSTATLDAEMALHRIGDDVWASESMIVAPSFLTIFLDDPTLGAGGVSYSLIGSSLMYDETATPDAAVSLLENVRSVAFTAVELNGRFQGVRCEIVVGDVGELRTFWEASMRPEVP